MLRTGIFLLTFLVNSVFPLNVNAATKAIRLGRLWDGHRVIVNATVIVENDRVQGINTGDEIPADAEVIDLRRYSGIPGLIDAHTHITYYWDGAPDTTPRRQPARHVAVTVFLAQENARKTLAAGRATNPDWRARGRGAKPLAESVHRWEMTGQTAIQCG